MLKPGTVVDATLIASPNLTNDKDGECETEMHKTKKGNQCNLGLKAHIGSDADSGLVRSAIVTAVNVIDVTQGHDLLHGKEKVVYLCRLPWCRQTARAYGCEISGGHAPEQAPCAGRYVLGSLVRAGRKSQGQRASQGRASISGDQAPVWPRQAALPRPGQECGTTGRAVHAVELVVGEQENFEGPAGMSAPAARAKAREQAVEGLKRTELAPQSAAVSSFGKSRVSSHFGGCCAYLSK
jgi:transposase, IS5 family